MTHFAYRDERNVFLQRILMRLYETHLPVANTEIAKDFYARVVGLPFAYRDPTRDIIFLWAGSKEQGMIGLWGPSTAYGPKNGIARKCHVAFAVSFDQLLAAIKRLNDSGIETLGFRDYQTHEPTVIGWMPSAQIYFRDPDGHMLEFISILRDPPDSTFIGSYSDWERLTKRSSDKSI
jgi:lactoylglutathione lyase